MSLGRRGFWGGGEGDRQRERSEAGEGRMDEVLGGGGGAFWDLKPRGSSFLGGFPFWGELSLLSVIASEAVYISTGTWDVQIRQNQGSKIFPVVVL